MKKIISLFMLLFTSIFLLVGCQEIAYVANELLSDVNTNEVSSIINEIADTTENIETEKPTEKPTEKSTEKPAEEVTEEIFDELPDTTVPEADTIIIEEDGKYTDKERVALYIHTYDKLPSNYITKNEAQKNGWDSKKNTMSKVLPGMSIGGDHFGNYEGKLPKEQGRSYKECDIDYENGSRNAKRIVYSNDGLIFYTEDHYNNFEQLY